MATELPWAKIGYLQSAPSNVSIDLIHDYWNMKKREGVTLGADFWQWEEGKELNPLLKILRDMPAPALP